VWEKDEVSTFADLRCLDFSNIVINLTGAVNGDSQRPACFLVVLARVLCNVRDLALADLVPETGSISFKQMDNRRLISYMPIPIFLHSRRSGLGVGMVKVKR
jgi:hypothetical protein